MTKDYRVFLKYQATKVDDKNFFVSKTINVTIPLPGVYIDLTQVEALMSDEKVNVEIDLPKSGY